MGRTVGVCLRPVKPRVTSAGCFAVDLAPVPPLAGSEADKRPILTEICTRINRNPAWRTDMMTGNLTLTSKQSWPVLKGLPALSARHQAALNLTAAPPDDAVIKAGLAAMGEAVDGRRRIDDLAVLNDIPPLVKFAEASINTSDLSPARKQEIEAQVEAANIKIEKIEDVCGPENNPELSRRIPDELLDIDLREVCRKHDERYATSGISKEAADEQFFEDILQICADGMPRNQGVMFILYYSLGCLALARGYFYGAKWGGQQYYDEAQETAKRGRE